MPVNYRGLLFDLAVFVCNVFLVRLLTRHIGRLLALTFLRDDPQASRTLLYVILVALAAQLVGACLKRRPLQARLLAQRESGESPLSCLIILHFALTLVTSAAIVALLLPESSGGTTVAVFFLSMIPTVLVWRAISPYKKPPAPDWRNSHGAEIVADLCLFAYMLVNLAVWNTVTSGSNIRAAGVGDVLSRALGFILLSPVILLFYLPPRLVFLVEDYKYPATWISMTLAVAPVAYRTIFGAPLKTDW
ncbi:MAG: hypothetical protein ACJ741_00890 [Pyrinomonadaceae bacterium]